MEFPFIDTNVFLRHLTGDPKDQAQKATAYLLKIERGEATAITSDIVIFEVVFTLERFYKLSKLQVRSAILPLLELPHLRLEKKSRLQKVFDLYVALNIPFADAYHVVFMEQHRITEVLSFDRHFDKVQEVNRTEP